MAKSPKHPKTPRKRPIKKPKQPPSVPSSSSSSSQSAPPSAPPTEDSTPEGRGHSDNTLPTQDSTGVFGISPFLTVLLATCCWVGGIFVLLFGIPQSTIEMASWYRVVLVALIGTAAILTFVPLGRAIKSPMLAAEGVGGTVVCCYTIAFVPPPTTWIFSLPDLPVYVLFAVGVFWSVTAIAQPVIYLIRRRVVKQRMRTSLPLPGSSHVHLHIHRQAAECGLFVAMVIVFAGLRVFSWMSVVLLVLILVTTELLFLSRSETKLQ